MKSLTPQNLALLFSSCSSSTLAIKCSCRPVSACHTSSTLLYISTRPSGTSSLVTAIPSPPLASHSTPVSSLAQPITGSQTIRFLPSLYPLRRPSPAHHHPSPHSLPSVTPAITVPSHPSPLRTAYHRSSPLITRPITRVQHGRPRARRRAGEEKMNRCTESGFFRCSLFLSLTHPHSHRFSKETLGESLLLKGAGMLVLSVTLAPDKTDT